MSKSIVFLILFVMICLITTGLSAEQSLSKNKDWTFKIISDTSYHQFKRTVEIRISDRISKDELKELAYKIKSMDRIKYERTFIIYYLPDMEVGHGAWATSHYDPELKVQILGTTNEQIKKMSDSTQEKNVDRNIIGSWFYEAPYISQTITLFRKENNVFMEVIYKDGSSSIDKLNETKTSKGMRYQEYTSAGETDYFIINQNGDLGIWDSYGLIGTAKKTKN